MSYRVDNSKNRNNKINQVVIGNDIFFFNKSNYYYSLSIPIKGYPALQIKKIKNLLVYWNATQWEVGQDIIVF